MNKDLLGKLILLHKGKIIGLGIGLVIGILVLTIGFWRAMFIIFSMGVGYWIGGISDKKEKFFALLDKMLPKGFN